jgi:Leucine-rich repeat (LRR) protein
LSYLPKLRKVTASDNYITSCNLNLPKLRDLELRNNFLTAVPNLKDLPALRTLNLNTNKMTAFKFSVTEQNLITIEKMDLSNNLVSFPEGKQMVNEFVERLRKFKNLSVLTINGNPFEVKNPEWTDFIGDHLPSCIKVFNNQKVEHRDDLRKNILKQEPVSTVTGGKDSKHKNKSVATLDMLCYHLEAANSHPNRTLDFLENLFFEAERIS